MAQHDYVIENQTRTALRADLNNALAATVSQNSGNSAPSQTYAYMLWAQPLTDTLWQRNASNSAWIKIRALSGPTFIGELTVIGEEGRAAIEIGQGATSNQSSYIDFVGDTTYADYGLRIIRGNAGANGVSDFYHRGTGNLRITTVDSASITFSTNSIERFRIEADGRVTAGGLSVLNAAASGSRNLLINGNPTINQREYVSGTATTSANQYTLDRWFVVTSGQSISWTDSLGIRTVTAPAGGVAQVIEGVSIVGTGTHVLNWTGTATATVNGAGVSKGVGFSLTGGANVTVKFSGGTFTKAQLEPGSIATSFEERLIGTELALCQRYFQTTIANIRANATAGGQIFENAFYATTQMRVTPTATRTGPVTNANYINILPGNFNGGRVEISAAAAGETYALNQYITLSAEL